MQEIYFSSKLNIKYKNDLERIFFFNSNQMRYTKRIEEALEKYGTPQISISDNQIIFSCTKVESIQALYGFDGEDNLAALLGTVIFFRDEESDMKIVHIAVDESCANQGEFHEEEITARLINEVRKISNSIKGVKTVTLPYCNNKISVSKKIQLV